MPPLAAPPTSDQPLASTRGVADRLGWDDSGGWGDAAYDAWAAAVKASAANLPGGWLLQLLPSEVVRNTIAMAEGGLLGVFDARPDTVDEFVANYWEVLKTVTWVSTGAIVFTDGYDLLAGIGEGIVAEFTDLYDLVVAVFDEATWTAMSEHIVAAISLLCGDRDRALGVGWAIGQAIASSVATLLLGPPEVFARALGKLLGPIILEIALSFVTGGVGLLALLGKYGVKAGRIGLRLSVEALDLIADVVRGTRRAPTVPVELDDVIRPRLTSPTRPPAPGPGPEPGRHAPISHQDRGLDRALSDRDTDGAGVTTSDRIGEHSPDVGADAAPPPFRPPRRTELTPSQTAAIDQVARHYARTNRAVDPSQLASTISKAAMRWAKLDIDDPTTVRELAKLLSATRRRHTSSGNAPVSVNRLGSAGELRLIERLNDTPAVGRIKMIAAPSRQRSPDFAVEFDTTPLDNFDVEVTTVTQLTGTRTTRVRNGQERVVVLPARDPDRSTGWVMPTRVEFDPGSVADAFSRKMGHGQLRGAGRPGRGAIAVNINQTPNATTLPTEHLDALRRQMDEYPEVLELWLIGPGGIEVVARKPNSNLSTLIGL